MAGGEILLGLFTIGFIAFVPVWMLIILHRLTVSHPDTSSWLLRTDLPSRRVAALGFFVFVVLLAFLNGLFAFGIVFAIGFVAVGIEMVELIRISAKDYRGAESVLGKISAFFGWTNAGKVAIGERSVFMSFPMLLTAHGLLALCCIGIAAALLGKA